MSHHPQDHFDAGSIAFASNADCDRATALFSQLANALQSEQLKNREAADALDAQAARIKELEGALRGFLAEFGDKSTNGNVKRAREALK
jgi:hypothetical protein